MNLYANELCAYTQWDNGRKLRKKSNYTEPNFENLIYWGGGRESGCHDGGGGGLLSPCLNLQVKGSGNFERKAASAAAEIATGSSAKHPGKTDFAC